MYHYAKAVFNEEPEQVIDKKHAIVIGDLTKVMNSELLEWNTEDLLFAWWCYWLLGDYFILEKLSQFDDETPTTIKEAAIKEMGLIMYAVNEARY